MHLLIMATSRFRGETPPDAESDLKALLKLRNGETLLSRMLTAADSVCGCDRKILVGPEEVGEVAEAHPRITRLAEGDSDYDSLLRGLLGCADSHRIVICAAHLPEVDGAVLENLAGNAPEDAALSLPVYSKEDFKRHYPTVRNAYVKLADGELTAPPAAVVQGAAMIRGEPVVRKLFEARGNPVSLAGMLGIGIVTRFLSGRLTAEDVRKKAEALLKGRCTLLRSCSPRLALSVTTPQSWADIRALYY